MAISISKLVCGNCLLCVDRRCTVSNDAVLATRMACSHIHNNYEDKGFVNEEMVVEPIVGKMLAGKDFSWLK